MKLLSLFVRYGDRDYKGAYQALQQLYERFSDVEIHSVLIDTALPNGVEAHIGNQALLMAGDNHRREFSGWDTALARYADQLDEFDLVHVVTSAFQNEYSGFYPLVRREMLDYLIDHPAQVLAHVDAYPDGVRLFGRGFQTWGCSKFLFASPATIRRLGVFVGPFDSTDFFLDEDDGLFAGRAPISSNYAKYLTDWLTGDGLPHGQWHSVFELNSASVEKFRSKALSILDEHSLSMRIRETGATIVDFTWWHANQLKGVPALPPEEILQVAERNRFLFGSEIVEPRVLRQDHPLPAKPAISRLLQHTADTPFGRSPLLESLRAGIEDVEESALDDPLQCAALHLLLGLALDDEQLAWLVAASDKAKQDAPLPITRGLHALWLAKADLKSAMDLDTRAGREALVGWWMSDGRHDKANDGVVLADAYGETSPLLEQDVPLPITRGLHALWLAKADLKSAMDLEMRAGREALVGWWMSDGRHDKANGGLMLADAYGKTSPFLEQDAPLPITRGLQALWLARHDLQGVFDISTPDGRKALVEWFVTYGKDDTAFVLPNAEATSTQFVQENRGRFIFGGVNIVGYARGEFGIGEDVRMATCALETTEFEHCVPGIPLKAGARMRDLTLRGYETGSPLYNVNLICLPHFESLRLLGASRHMILDRRYNIAFWQWELARFPEAMKSALEIVDEIWSISDFAASAMRGATDKSVYSMPLVVELPVMTQKYLRADFGLPEGDFVFLTVLDGFSSIPRKNPQAAVNAFKRAFPGSNGVRLVIKAMNVDVAMPAWKALLDSVTGDSRIKIIAETFSKEKLLALQKVSDCFVSLHRAEGFGRNIAEAMLLGKPVIVSNYSGNTDFTTNSTAFLVEGDMIEIHRGEYPLSDQQVWFDPEVVMASEQMIKCVQDSAARNLKALAGKELVQERYSRNAVGQKYRNRLTQIAFE
ncbi:hypothetical protein AT959_12200 [Dechloromonas denitrificans]|uniref:Glycosyl transferase family 1 domain-containing protein n=1 Tax=Dechloromonas denitrificans TaxID=281362 RepID=A0A133XGR3_9RHOO|nr:glycosyltransferase [Dechloromonas denitrificans]KXB30130.1 hypothetical protein AT959_12200 [Dechloromonas denitrificans]